MLVQGVAADELALGYFGYAYYEENRAMLWLCGRSTTSIPTTARARSLRRREIRARRHLPPLSRPIFIYVAQAQPRPRRGAAVSSSSTSNSAEAGPGGGLHPPGGAGEYVLAQHRLAAARARHDVPAAPQQPGVTIESLLTGTGGAAATGAAPAMTGSGRAWTEWVMERALFAVRGALGPHHRRHRLGAGCSRRSSSCARSRSSSS